MIGAVDDMNMTLVAKPLDRGSAENLKQINPGLAARKHEHHAHAPYSDTLELPAEIARKPNAQVPSQISQSRLQG
jgi:hypothetical protein